MPLSPVSVDDQSLGFVVVVVVVDGVTDAVSVVNTVVVETGTEALVVVLMMVVVVAVPDVVVFVVTVEVGVGEVVVVAEVDGPVAPEDPFVGVDPVGGTDDAGDEIVVLKGADVVVDACEAVAEAGVVIDVNEEELRSDVKVARLFGKRPAVMAEFPPS